MILLALASTSSRLVAVGGQEDFADAEFFGALGRASSLSMTAFTSSSPTLTPLSIFALCSRRQAISPSIWRRIDADRRAVGGLR